MTYFKKSLALLTVITLLFVSLFSFSTVYAEEITADENIGGLIPITPITPPGEDDEPDLPNNLPEIDPIEDGAVYRIKNLQTGRYLTLIPNSNGVYDATLNNIATINTLQGSSQEFRIEDNFGTYYIRAIKSSNGTNRLVDVYSSNINQIVDGANVHLHPPGDENSSQWLIEYNATLGRYAIKIACKPNLAITDVSGNAQINTFSVTNTAQNWIFERVESETNINSGDIYRIRDLNSGLYVSVPGNDANISNVELANGNIALLNQQFKIVYDETYDFYRVHAMMSANGGGRVLDIDSTSASPPVNNRNVHIYDFEATATFNSCGWQIVKIGEDSNNNDIVKIYSDFNNNLALTAANGGTATGTNVRVNTYTGETYQKWVLEKLGTLTPVNITYQGDNKIKVGNTAVESNETLQLSINQYGLTTSDFEWRSSHDTVADVDNNGVVDGIAAGAATITATCTVNGIYYVGTVEINVFRSMADIAAQFPHGKYWNHIAGSTDVKNSITNSPCTSHQTNGTYICNSYDGAIQCMGFAKYIGFCIYGVKPGLWTESLAVTSTDEEEAMEELNIMKAYTPKPGDYICYYTNAEKTAKHVIVILECNVEIVNGKTVKNIEYVDCNNGSRCRINWTHTGMPKTYSDLFEHGVEIIRIAPYAWE